MVLPGLWWPVDIKALGELWDTDETIYPGWHSSVYQRFKALSCGSQHWVIISLHFTINIYAVFASLSSRMPSRSFLPTANAHMSSQLRFPCLPWKGGTGRPFLPFGDSMLTCNGQNFLLTSLEDIPLPRWKRLSLEPQATLRQSNLLSHCGWACPSVHLLLQFPSFILSWLCTSGG